MRGKDEFSEYHPLVNFLFFVLVFGFGCMVSHPVLQLLSLFVAIIYAKKLFSPAVFRSSWHFLLPSAVMIALINPAFQHRGLTILCYLPSGNPLTLESILYGIFSAISFSAIFLWFGILHEVFQSDKFIYLFGKIIPAFSLLLSMALRFLPRFKENFDAIKEAQLDLGLYRGEKKSKRKIKLAFSVFSATVTNALENAIETSDSMKSRGYGLKGRTFYSPYQFTGRDRYALFWLFFCGLILFCASLSGAFSWRWYPSVRGTLFETKNICLEIFYFALLFTPLWIDGREERKWKSLRSKI